MGFIDIYHVNVILGSKIRFFLINKTKCLLCLKFVRASKKVSQYLVQNRKSLDIYISASKNIKKTTINFTITIDINAL